MTRLYMLDTNIASHVIKGDIPEVRAHLVRVPMHSVVISAVTAGELLYGVAKRGNPEGLKSRVWEFLRRVEVQPWSDGVARCYGEFRASVEAAGRSLSALDMMIAAHAVAIDATLVTRDRAFTQLLGIQQQTSAGGQIAGRDSLLRLADWSIEEKF